MLTVCYRR